MIVYQKVGKRYKEIGEWFTGFPCNGIWLVVDGSRNCVIQLDHISENMPVVKDYVTLEQQYRVVMQKVLLQYFFGDNSLELRKLSSVSDLITHLLQEMAKVS